MCKKISLIILVFLMVSLVFLIKLEYYRLILIENDVFKTNL